MRTAIIFSSDLAANAREKPLEPPRNYKAIGSHTIGIGSMISSLTLPQLGFLDIDSEAVPPTAFCAIAMAASSCAALPSRLYCSEA